MTSLAIAKNSASNEAPTAQVPALKVPTSQVAGPEEKSSNGDGFFLDRDEFVHFQKFDGPTQQNAAVREVMSVNAYTHVCNVIWSTVSTTCYINGEERSVPSLSFSVGVSDYVPGTFGYNHYRGIYLDSLTGKMEHRVGGWYVGNVYLRSTHFSIYTVEVLREVLSSLREEMTGKRVKNDNYCYNQDIYFGKDVKDLIIGVEARFHLIAIALKEDIKERFGIEEPIVEVDFCNGSFQKKLRLIDAEFQKFQ